MCSSTDESQNQRSVQSDIAASRTLPAAGTSGILEKRMQIRVKLMGALKRKAPPEDVLELSEGASIDDALAALEIEAPQVQIVMVNGKPRPDRSSQLNHGDEITVVAPVGGG